MKTLVFSVILAVIVAVTTLTGALDNTLFAGMHYSDVAGYYGWMNLLSLWFLVIAFARFFNSKHKKVQKIHEDYLKKGLDSAAEGLRLAMKFNIVVLIVLFAYAANITSQALGFSEFAKSSVMLVPSEPRQYSCDEVIDARMVTLQKNLAVVGAYADPGSYKLGKIIATRAYTQLIPDYPECKTRWVERFDIYGGSAHHTGA